MVGPTKTTTIRGWRVRCWRIEVLAGPSMGRVRIVEQGTVRIGTAPTCELQIDDPAVSREHLIAEISHDGVRIVDRGSKNGTYLEGARLDALRLPPGGAVLSLGTSKVGFFPADEVLPIQPATSTRCGRLVGQSEAMRTLFAQIARIAASNATVLIHGETGTGKELVASAIHELSPRADKPFVIVDCGAIPRDLIESEFFGHARGAFTGAVSEFRGAFERAHGGTIFLDEIGELPLDLQPKLLRVLETGALRPLGREHMVEVDVRVVAASLRDLAEERAERRFREDLFFRLAVVELDVPPLRDHVDDIPMLIEEIAGKVEIDAASLDVLRCHTWPGNVRELRNLLERALAFSPGQRLKFRTSDLPEHAPKDLGSPIAGLPYKDAKDLMVAEFTKEYLDSLLRRHRGNISAAAREAKIDRNWIVALSRRHGVNLKE